MDHRTVVVPSRIDSQPHETDQPRMNRRPPDRTWSGVSTRQVLAAIWVAVVALASVVSMTGATGAFGPTAAAGPSAPGLQPTGDGVDVSVRWTGNVTAGNNDTTVGYEGGVVYAKAGRTLAAFDASTGSRIARRRIPENATLDGLTNDTVYLTEPVGNRETVHALDGGTLSTRWTRTFSDDANAEELVVSSNHAFTVAAPTADTDQVVALDPATGDTQWTANVTEAGIVHLRLGGTLVFSNDAGLTAFDPATGSVAWSRNSSAIPYPRIAGGTVHLLTRSPPTANASGVYAVGYDADDGSVAYERSVGVDTAGGQQYVVVRGTPYFVSSGARATQVTGFDPATGAVTTTIRYGQRALALTTGDRDTPYLVLLGTVEGETGYLVFNASAGSKAGNVSFTNGSATLYGFGFDLDGRTFYSGTRNGTVTAYRVTDPTASPVRAIAGSDRRINTAELRRAISYWVRGSVVPGTGGRTIDTQTLRTIISAWVRGSTVAR